MEEEIKSSKFNAGVLQTVRIDKILDLLNFCKINPIAWNEDQLDWNYNVWMGCVENLYGEVEGFLSKLESDGILTIKLKIDEMIKTYPIRENYKKPNQINVSNFEVIKKAISYYERVVKRYGVKYKLLAAFERAAGRI